MRQGGAVSKILNNIRVQSILDLRPDGEIIQTIREGLRRDIEVIYGPANRSEWGFNIELDNKLVGGLLGVIHWNWMYISHLWISSENRGRGLATEVLSKALRWGRELKLEGAYVDTFSEQTMSFYEKKGFSAVGIIPELPKHHNRYYLYISFT